MKRLIATAAITSCLLRAATCAQETDPHQADLAALAANATAFVDAYNKADHQALADLFLPGGEIVLASGEILAGRPEIAAFYQELLSGAERPKAALEAGSVRFVTPSLAIEDGTLHVTQPSGLVVSHRYTAVQAKQPDGAWLTASIRDEIKDIAPASEKLAALQWLIGDWLIEKDGSRTFLSFDWSEDGPFIDGLALTEAAGLQSTGSSYRIGWNSARENFVSWAFDAQGGYNKAEWTRTDDGFLLRSSGVTADGEVTHATQSLVPDPNLQGFSWSTRDQVIHGELQPDLVIRVVKRPPPPAPSTPPGPQDGADE